MTLTALLHGDESLVIDAEAAIAATLTPGAPSVPSVTVTRAADGLHVRASGLETRSAEEREAAVMRIVAAVLACEGSARSISIERDIVT